MLVRETLRTPSAPWQCETVPTSNLTLRALLRAVAFGREHIGARRSSPRRTRGACNEISQARQAARRLRAPPTCATTDGGRLHRAHPRVCGQIRGSMQFTGHIHSAKLTSRGFATLLLPRNTGQGTRHLDDQRVARATARVRAARATRRGGAASAAMARSRRSVPRLAAEILREELGPVGDGQLEIGRGARARPRNLRRDRRRSGART